MHIFSNNLLCNANDFFLFTRAVTYFSDYTEINKNAELNLHLIFVHYLDNPLVPYTLQAYVPQLIHPFH